MPRAWFQASSRRREAPEGGRSWLAFCAVAPAAHAMTVLHVHADTYSAGFGVIAPLSGSVKNVLR